MKRIAIVTRDCAGINAAIRSIVRNAVYYDMEVLGAIKGYNGLIDDDLIALDRRSVSGIINLGGTILKTARAYRFFTEQGQQQAVDNIIKNKIDGLIVVGGNGSLAGAHLLAKKYNIPVIGIPATIDNDINGIDLSLGADTAVNVALDALDKIRDTATSLERAFIVELMGRNCGYLALEVALAGGCEDAIIPEKNFDIDKMCQDIEQGREKGKISWIITVSEGKAKATEIAKIITDRTGLETRTVVLGHIQRGGRPTAVDRVMAARLGELAVSGLNKGKTDVCVGRNKDKLISLPLNIAIQPKKISFAENYRLIRILT
jgi:6-phosphofructokinase 1